MKPTRQLLGTLWLMTIAASVSFAADTRKPDRAAWQQWHHQYQESYQRTDGWLSLVGLYWLKQGKNTLGSCQDNLHQMPDSAPCHFGTLTLAGRRLHLQTRAPVIVDGQSTTKLELSVNQPTVHFGRYWFYIIEREKGFALRLGDRKNPKLNNFQGIPFYPFNPQAVVRAHLEAPDHPQTIPITTVYGTTRKTPVAGWLYFRWKGQALKLLAVNYGEDEPLGIMFADETNQVTTYGAGRYLDVAWPDANGDTWIDFNRSYNPPCAYTNFATCPLPPPENRLPIKVEAGARYLQTH